MKRLIIIVLLLLPLIACEAKVTKDFEAILLSASNDIPEVITSNFPLPNNIEECTITYEILGTIYENEYIYESPYYDIPIEITIKAQYKSTFKTLKKEAYLVASYSGLNNSRIDINLNGSIETMTKETYQKMSLTINTNINGVQTTTHEDISGKMRGRGNSTWDKPKKPFKIKFDDKQSILGLPNSKEYVLLAEYSDKSLLRNTLTHQLSKILNVDHYLETRYVDLYVNDDYQGLYVLTEQVEIKEEKLFFETNYEGSPLSFFMELDYRYYDYPDNDPNAWVLHSTGPYEIKYPDPEDKKFKNNFKDLVKTYLDSVYLSLTINTNQYEDYIDVENWIDYFLLQELSKNVDIGMASVFLYKTESGKLKFGPLWDFDLAYGNADYIDFSPYNYYGPSSDKNIWFLKFMQVKELRELFAERAREILPILMNYASNIITCCEETLDERAKLNFQKWKILNIYVWPNPQDVVKANSFVKQGDYVLNFLMLRTNYILTSFKTNDYQNGSYFH